jgi:hypothetical protein
VRTFPLEPAVSGNVAVVATKFVPSARRILPVPVAVDGYVAVLNAGVTPTPAPCNTFPEAAVSTLIAFLVTT